MIDGMGRVKLTRPDSSICELGNQFRTRILALFTHLGMSPTRAQIDLAKAVLADTYMSYRNRADDRHRSYLGDEHVCLFGLWELAHERLEELRVRAELSLLIPKDVERMPTLSMPRAFSLAASLDDLDD